MDVTRNPGNRAQLVVVDESGGYIAGVVLIDHESGLPYTVGGVASLGQKSASNSSPVVIASDQPRVPTDILGAFVFNARLTSTASVAAYSLTASAKRVSLQAIGSDARFSFGTSSADAITKAASSTTSIRVIAGSERDFALPANCTFIGYVRDSAATSDGIIEITEIT